MTDTDNNKMTANDWKRAVTDQIDEYVVSKKDPRNIIFERLKSVISDSVSVIRGKAKRDDKYVKIVDLMLARFRAAISNIDIESINNQKINDFIGAVEDKLSDFISDRMVAAHGSAAGISIKEICQVVQTSLENAEWPEYNSDNQTARVDQSQEAEQIQISDEANTQAIQFGAGQQFQINNVFGRIQLKNIQVQNNSKQAGVSQHNAESGYSSVQTDFSVFRDTKILPFVNRFLEYQFAGNTVSKGFVQFIENIDKRIIGFQFASKNIFGVVAPIKIIDVDGQYYEKTCFTAIKNQLDQISTILDGVIAKIKLLSRKKKKTTPGMGIHIGYAGMLDAYEFGGIHGKLNKSISVYKDLFKKNLELLHKAYNALKPKGILERVMDWIKQKVLIIAVQKVLFKVIGEMPWLKYFKDRLKPVYDSCVKHITTRIKNFVKGITSVFKLFFKSLKKILSSIWKGIKIVFQKTVNGILKLIKGVLRLVYNLAKSLEKTLWRIIKSIYNFIKNNIGKFFKNMASKFNGFLKKLASKFKNISKMFQKIKNFFSKIGKFFKNLKNAFAKMTSKIKSIIKAVKTKIANIIKTVANKIVNVVKTVVKKIVETVVKVIRSVVKKIVTYVKKKVIQIFKKIAINFAKKTAVKKAKGIGIKILVKFFKKFLTKFIAKLAVKIAASVAVNCIPILGQVISVCMMLWTIMDTILMVWDIYKLFKDNPMLWDMAKEKVAEWAASAFSFIKDLCEWGKKIFKKIIKAYKDAGHAVGDALFSSNKVMHATYNRNLQQLKRWITMNRKRVLREKNDNPKEFFRQNLNNPKIYECLNKIDEINNKIFNEDDSWWRDTDQMTVWMNERQPYYKQLITLLANGGIFSLTGLFDSEFVSDTRAEILMVKRRLEMELAEETKQRELNRFRNVRLNFKELRAELAELNKSVLERRKNINELYNYIESQSAQAKTRLSEAFPDVIDDGLNGGDEDEEKTAA